MFYFNRKFFALLLWCILLPFQSATIYNDQYLKAHDDALLEFVRGPTKFGEFCTRNCVTNAPSLNLLAQFYGMNIGILSFMRLNWNCDKAEADDEQEECNKYHHYMDILYEYLFNVYAGRIAVKPIFSKKPFRNYIDLVPPTLLIVLERLSRNAKYYFGNKYESGKEPYHFQLENGDDLDYYKGKKTKQSTETPKVIEPIRMKFDKIMHKMLKKTLEKARSTPEEHAEQSQKIYEKELEIAKLENDFKSYEMPTPPKQLSFWQEDAAKQCAFISNFLIFYYMCDAIEEEAFVDFVKGKENFDMYFNNMLKLKPGSTKNFYLDQFESEVVLLYVMKKNWKCANAKFKDECEEIQHYFYIVFDYLFRVCIGIPSVRPMFQFRLYGRGEDRFAYGLNHQFIIVNLCSVLIFLGEFEIGKYALQNTLYLKLINETELNLKINSEISEITFEEQLVLMAKEVCDRKNGDKKEQQINATEMEDLIRSAFELTLKKKYEKRIKEAFEARKDLDVLQLKIIKEGTEKYEDEFGRKSKDYKYKYWRLMHSPFVPELSKKFFELDLRDMQESIWKIGLFSVGFFDQVNCRECEENGESDYYIAHVGQSIEMLKDHLFSPIHANSEYAKKYLKLEKEKRKNT